MKTVGLIVAMKQELGPFLSYCQLLSEEKQDGFTFYQLEKDGDEWVLVFCGIGKKNAQAAASVLVKNYQPHALLSAGFAGYTGEISRESSLIYLPKRIIDLGEDRQIKNIFDVSPHWWQETWNVDFPVQGTLLSVEKIVRLASEKKELGTRYPGALIDMETSGVAAIARLARIPFLSIRIVSDDAKKDLSLDFQPYLGKNNKIQYGNLFEDMVLNPRMAFNFLGFLARNRKLARQLADYLDKIPGSPEELSSES